MQVNSGRVLNDATTDPNYGLALDHALLLQNPHSEYLATIRFWSNPPSVIIGRGQTLSNEVNQTFCRENQIPISRRITGGGTVYHDPGNLNISLIFPKKIMENPDNITETTTLFTNLLKTSLEASGIEEMTTDKYNNLFYKNRKVSGAAAYFNRDTILHHSTLLLATDLTKLEGSLIRHRELRRGCSRYSPTTNLTGLQPKTWKKTYVKTLEEKFRTPFRPGVLTLEEEALARELKETMYRKSSWIIDGERPKEP